MEDLNYSISSPLYGRATCIIKVMPLRLDHVLAWYGSDSDIESVMDVYFTVGGIPRYLELIPIPSIESIKACFFSKDSLLLREGKLFLKESFPSSLVIPKILVAVVRGITEATKIADAVQVKPSEISKYLGLLCDYGFIEKRFPVAGGGKKDVRFYPRDRFFAFWSRFIGPFYNEIESDVILPAVSLFEQEFTTHHGYQFESTVLEIILDHPDFLGFTYTRAGRQWGRIHEKYKPEPGKNVYEIDICLLDDDNQQICVAECKWKDNVDASKIIKNLVTKIKYIDWHGDQRLEFFAIFAKSFSTKIHEFGGNDVKCIDLMDINTFFRKSERIKT